MKIDTRKKILNKVALMAEKGTDCSFVDDINCADDDFANMVLSAIVDKALDEVFHDDL